MADGSDEPKARMVKKMRPLTPIRPRVARVTLVPVPGGLAGVRGP